jgi:hypothetical protein
VVTLGDAERERPTRQAGVLTIRVRPWEIVTLRATR